VKADLQPKNDGLLTAVGTLMVLLGSVLGCSPKIIVKSEPGEANVYVVTPEKGEKKLVGKTPIESEPAKIRELLGEEKGSDQYFELVVEKEKFKAERLLVPYGAMGTLVTEVQVKMKEGVDEERTAMDLVQSLLLAQKFASLKEYERAVSEIDKILAQHPKFVRALAMKGAVYFVQKKWDESARWYEEALKIDPQLQESTDMLAKIKDAREGKRQPAREQARARR
jgi:tetratricopeptide (TPR) repeat protein